MFANFPNIHYNECIFTFVFLPKSKPISASYSLCHLDKSFNASDLRNLEVQVGRCWFCRVETLQRRTGSSKSRSLLYRSAEQTRAWLPVTSQFLPSEPDSISSVYAMTLANRWRTMLCPFSSFSRWITLSSFNYLSYDIFKSLLVLFSPLWIWHNFVNDPING